MFVVSYFCKMRNFILVLISMLSSLAQLHSQKLTSIELLDRAISFHDPKGAWKSFNGNFKVLMETPTSSDRLSVLWMNHPEQKFGLEVKKDNDSYRYIFDKDSCVTTFNGSDQISEEDRKKYRLTCERGKMMRNYYTYLYGLPMKLRDPGTLLDPTVNTKTFKGKEYLVLKVNYDEEVGKDVWYFYFDPTTYAMEVYQFYHDERKNDGEYILLKDLVEVQGIKMPKDRSWYMNKDDKFLGKDILLKE